MIAPLLSRLGAALSAQGVNVPAVLSIFHAETALALGPSNGGSPSLLIVARPASEADARATLASLWSPLAQLFAQPAAGAGQTPLANDFQVGSADVHELSLAPGLRLDYTVANGLVIVATSRSAVTQVISRARALDADSAYRNVLPTHPQGVSSLLSLDFNQLLNLVDQTGLTRGPRFSALRPDLQMIRAVGLRTTSGEADSTVELFLQIT